MLQITLTIYFERVQLTRMYYQHFLNSTITCCTSSTLTDVDKNKAKVIKKLFKS